MFPKIYSNTVYPVLSLIGSLKKKRKYQLFFLTFLMVLSALSEIFSLASFIPFITSLSNPEKLLSLNFINQINFFSSISQQNLMFAGKLLKSGILKSCRCVQLAPSSLPHPLECTEYPAHE